MNTSTDIAALLLERAKEQDNPLTPMQLLKLVYICHGWMLAGHGKPLVSDNAEAWQYGPVFKKLYSSVKGFKSQPVTKVKNSKTARLNELDQALVEAVFDHYSQYSGIALSKMTHQAGSPWDVTWSKHGKNAIISNDLIEEHYSKLMASED